MNSESYNAQEIDLIEMLKYIWKHIVVVAIIGAVCAIAFGGYTILKNSAVPDENISDELPSQMYISETDIYFAPSFKGDDIAAEVNAQKSLVNDYKEIALTRSVVEDAVSMQNLDLTYEEAKGRLRSELIGDTRIVRIQAVDAESPEHAQKLAAGVAQAACEKVSSMSDITKPEIIEAASCPTEKTDTPDGFRNKAEVGSGRKSPIKYALIGLIAGLFIGCAYYGLIYIFSDRILKEEDVERFLHLNTIAVSAGDEDLDTAIKRLNTQIDFTAVTIDNKKSLLDYYMEAAEIAKEGTGIIAVVPVGAHAKIVERGLQQIKEAGGKVIGVLLTEQ